MSNNIICLRYNNNVYYFIPNVYDNYTCKTIYVITYCIPVVGNSKRNTHLYSFRFVNSFSVRPSSRSYFYRCLFPRHPNFENSGPNVRPIGYASFVPKVPSFVPPKFFSFSLIYFWECYRNASIPILKFRYSAKSNRLYLMCTSSRDSTQLKSTKVDFTQPSKAIGQKLNSSRNNNDM